MSDDKIDILIVDDLPDKLLVLQSVLAELGESVIAARSGLEALERVLRHDFAVILLDVNMPDMDGFETAALIRKRKRSAHVPIIFITAYADEMHTAQGYSLGAVDYILSPVVPVILRTKVKVFVDLFRMTQKVKRQAEERIALLQEQAARAAAEESNRRLAFLARAGNMLGRSLDCEATARDAARLAVPFLADLSAVTLVHPEGEATTIWKTVVAQAGPEGGSILNECEGYAGLPDQLTSLLDAVIKSGVAELVQVAEPEANGALGRPIAKNLSVDPMLAPEKNAHPLPSQTNPAREQSATLVLPLPARGRMVGALTLVLNQPNRRFGTAEIAMAEAMASRAAIALDNALLYGDVQRADRQKNEFLSMLAHELRNPLAPIRNAVHILRLRGQDQPELQWSRDVVERQVAQLVRLVDDLLDVSRITQGKIRLQMEPVQVQAVVTQALETSRPLVDERRHQLSVSVPPEPLWVFGDSIRLAQVLTNLLNNAAKYTDEGGRIELAVTARPVAEDRGAKIEERRSDIEFQPSILDPRPSLLNAQDVEIRVRDSGIGIPAAMLSSIFDLFTQVDRALDRSQGGLGIGLTLVRHLVQMHDGRVRAYSRGPGQGSEFVLQLPAIPAPVAPPTNGAVPPTAGGAPGRILVVDDNRDAAISLAILLRLEGYEVRVVHDGPAALELVHSFLPHVVLLDIGLPEMDGYEVARRLRQDPAMAGTMLVAITGYSQESNRERSREAGFDHYLVKPVDPQVLSGLLSTQADDTAPAKSACACP
jgi:signal transduction histidine kinase/DNA-binding response OmpR family regulator